MIAVLGGASLAFVAWFTWHQYTSIDPGTGPQTRRASIVEAWVNIVIGFSINFAMNYALIPLMTEGHSVTAANNWWGGWVYTAASILRQYAIRRWFNARIHDLAVWLAGK